MRKKNYTFWLVITYIIMAVVCAALIIFFRQDLTSVIINVAMFALVAIIFIYAIGKFSKAWRFQKALSTAAKKIREDAKSDSRYLWEQYRKSEVGGLFPDDILTRQYQKFVTEMDRLEQFKNGDYKCNIEDYINKEHIDAALNKNILNLVPGTMTGLGILGTFVGLSFGLQFFNTGTAAEITESISPLMEGIKVAFHTSIYGMVFSLVFNFVYRGTMEATYAQLDDFLNAFNTYVLGDSFNDNESRMREMIQNLPQALGETISEQMGKSLTPIVYNMNKSMMDFAQTISESQAEGLKGLVHEFIDELNTQMGNSYREFGRVLGETCEIQRQNNQYAQTVMDRLARVADNVSSIDSLSLQIMNSMAAYVNEVEKLQSIISDNYNSTYRQMEVLEAHEEKMQSYVSAIAENERAASEGIRKELDEILNMSRSFTETMHETSLAFTEMLSAARVEIDSAARELSGASVDLDEKLSATLKGTFSMFDSNMAQITNHLSTTVSQIESATDRVPEVVVAAYEGMRKSLEDVINSLNRIKGNN